MAPAADVTTRPRDLDVARVARLLDEALEAGSRIRGSDVRLAPSVFLVRWATVADSSAEGHLAHFLTWRAFERGYLSVGSIQVLLRHDPDAHEPVIVWGWRHEELPSVRRLDRAFRAGA